MEPRLIGKVYYVRFSFQSKQYRFSLKTTNKKVADQIANQIERGLERGVFDSFEEGAEGERILKTMIARPGLRAEEALEEIQSKGKKKNFREAVGEYLANCRSEHSPKNFKNELRVFNQFSERINVSFVHQVTPEMVEKWRNARVSEVDKSTVNRELKMVKRFFRQAVEKGYLQKSPADSLKTYREPEKPIRHLSDSEVKRLLEAAPDDLRQITVVFLLTGLRYGELCHLTWSDIDFRRKQVIVQPKNGWNPKNFKKRVIPMHSTVEQILKGFDRNGSEYVFPETDGGTAEGGLRNRIYRVFKAAKVPGNVKALRSTFASNAVMSGLPIYTVSKLLGHHDVKITEKHYADLAPDYLAGSITMLKPNWSAKAIESEEAAV